MNITTKQLRQIIKEEFENLMGENNIFDNIRKKKEYCKKNPSASKCKKEDRPSAKNWKKATKNEEVTDEEEKELAKIKDELKGASKMHKSQSDRIKKITANENKKNCGCGQDPCKTYGVQKEADLRNTRDTYGDEVVKRNKKTFNNALVEDELEEKKKKKKACKPSKGKRYAERGSDGKCRSYGQAGKSKKGGDRIQPGTAKGHAYCARSAEIPKCDDPPCPNDLSRKKWHCKGKRSDPD